MKTEIERLKKSNPNQTAKDRFKAAALNVIPPPLLETLLLTCVLVVEQGCWEPQEQEVNLPSFLVVRYNCFLFEINVNSCDVNLKPHFSMIYGNDG